jgi:hypothetical protein
MSIIITNNKPTKPAPVNHSGYDRTYNNAIDLVAQMVGYYRKKQIPLVAIKLKPGYFYLFQAGLQALMRAAGKKYDATAVMTFEGVRIEMGNERQFDSALPVHTINTDQVDA